MKSGSIHLAALAALTVLLLTGCVTPYQFDDGAEFGDYSVDASEQELRFSRGKASVTFKANSQEAQINNLTALHLPWKVRRENGKYQIEPRLLERIVEPLLFGTAEKARTVVVDAGHGGNDPGAVGAEYKEKDLNLAVALLLKAELEKRGLSVVMTKETDIFIPLLQRVNIADDAKAQLFISIHHNAATNHRARGYSVYAPRDCSKHPGASLVLAADIQYELQKLPQVVDRGVNFADFVVLRANMPAVLVELGFISNPTEELMIGAPSRQKIEAAAIAEGVMRYLRRTGEKSK